MPIYEGCRKKIHGINTTTCKSHIRKFMKTHQMTKNDSKENAKKCFLGYEDYKITNSFKNMCG